jgi:hypothetical protein
VPQFPRNSRGSKSSLSRLQLKLTVTDRDVTSRTNIRVDDCRPSKYGLVCSWSRLDCEGNREQVQKCEIVVLPGNKLVKFYPICSMLVSIFPSRKCIPGWSARNHCNRPFGIPREEFYLQVTCPEVEWPSPPFYKQSINFQYIPISFELSVDYPDVTLVVQVGQP